jgi:AraC family transcriptional regulator
VSGIVSIYQGPMGRISLFDTNVSVVEHVHPQLHVMIKISGSDSIYQVGDSACTLSDDQMVLVNSWTPHSNWRSSDDPGTLMIALYIEPPWMRSVIGWPVETTPPFAMPVAPVSPCTYAWALEIADLLATSFRLQEESLCDRVGCLLRGVLAGFDAMQTPWPPPRPVNHRIRRAISILRCDGGPRGKLKRLPKSVGLSRSSFYELFKTSTGVPPGLYADGITLDHAVRALVETEKPIGEISAELGFSAQSHFTRFFKSKVCFTPSEFRHVASCSGSTH